MAKVQEGTLLWEPPAEWKREANITRYMEWLQRERGVMVSDYASLWRWSVSDLEGFWESIWQYFRIQSAAPYTAVLEARTMPGARWFPGAKLNYAEHVFRAASPDRPAIIAESELRPRQVISWSELRRCVGAVAAALRRLGVRPGDRIAAYIPNIPEAAIAALAAASLGAVWSSCSPDFGTGSVVDRFSQIEPKVLLTVDGYRYGGKDYDRREAIRRIQQALPSVDAIIAIPYLHAGTPDPGRLFEDLGRVLLWDELLAEPGTLSFEPVPFDHPLWILYSSGTTGLPKPIVHGQGGILLEHSKILSLHHDLKPGDRFFWFTTTGWMMWNYLLSGLLIGCTIVLYDGNPGYPDMYRLWRLAAETKMTLFGTSAPYVTACLKEGITPGDRLDLSTLRSVGSTGAPLSPEGFAWLYEAVKKDLWVASVSGGTDVCTAFVAGCPLLPVHAGELQCLALGCKVEAFDDEGRPVTDQVGELVITEPMPSMPVCFWNDPDGRRYRESYFGTYPGVWRHGDWIRITPRGSAVIYGRSDATINRRGVRMGTAELYRVLDEIPEIADSLVVCLDRPGGESFMPLFVVLRPGVRLDDDLKNRINARIREELSPRHVPDAIVPVPEIPTTLNGKKMEVPVRRILMGQPVDRAVNRDSMANPQAIEYIVEAVRDLNLSF